MAGRGVMGALGVTWAPEPLPEGAVLTESTLEADGERWGVELVLDLGGCDPAVIGSRRRLKRYVRDLCKTIGMRRYRRTRAKHFGEGRLAGWTVVQLITTSSIVVHAVDCDASAHINVFSCKDFDTAAAAEFTRQRLGTAAVRARVLVRTVPR